MYGKIQKPFKRSVYQKNPLLVVYTGYLFVSCVAIFTGFILILGLLGLIVGIVLHYVCYVQIFFQLL